MKRVLAGKDVISAPGQVAPAVQYFTRQTCMPAETAQSLIKFSVQKIFSWIKCGKENKYINSGI